MADRYLVDTSVFARWYIEQVGYEHALRIQAAFLAGDIVLETLDAVRFELGHVLRKKGLLSRQMSRQEYLVATRSLDDLGVVVHVTDADRLERAAALAADTPMGFFDALLVDCSVELGLPLLTADARLCNSSARLTRTELLEGIR